MTTEEAKAKRNAYMREYRKTKPGYYKRHAEIIRRWRKKNHDKDLAHGTLHNAIVHGQIIRPKICEYCTDEGLTHAHHWNYEERLNVTWLCEYCHKSVHVQLKEEENE